MSISSFHRLALGALLAWACAAQASEAPPPAGVVALTASASGEVQKDMMSVTLSVTRDGQDANAVQVGLKQAGDAPLAAARPGARPRPVGVQAGALTP